MFQKIRDLFNKNTVYSPNYVLLTCSLALFLIILLCGKSLYIPASRVKNLYLRSVLLASADGLSYFSSQIGFDLFVPQIRSHFIEVTALDTNSAWDTRYFNSPSRDTLSLENSKKVITNEGSLLASKTAINQGETTINQGETAITQGETATNHGETTINQISATKYFKNSESSYIQKTFSSSNPLRLYMFGDSQVFSLGSGFSRLSGKNGPISVEFLAIHSSGFIRSDYFNWPKKLEDEFSTNQYDAAAIMLGMNDYQNFWNDDKKIVKTGTDAWKDSYKQRCRTILDITIASVSRVYWIQMPLVRTSKYAESLYYIEQIHDELAAEYSPDVLQRVSLRDVLPGTNGSYNSNYEMQAGKIISVMSEDGSHYTVEGGQLVTQGLFDLICRDFLFSEVPVAHLPE